MAWWESGAHHRSGTSVHASEDICFAFNWLRDSEGLDSGTPRNGHGVCQQPLRTSMPRSPFFLSSGPVIEGQKRLTSGEQTLANLRGPSGAGKPQRAPAAFSGFDATMPSRTNLDAPNRFWNVGAV